MLPESSDISFETTDTLGEGQPFIPTRTPAYLSLAPLRTATGSAASSLNLWFLDRSLVDASFWIIPLNTGTAGKEMIAFDFATSTRKTGRRGWIFAFRSWQRDRRVEPRNRRWTVLLMLVLGLEISLGIAAGLCGKNETAWI
jgi:hypothetical protein